MRKEHWQDWGTALVGACVFVSPWFLRIGRAPNEAIPIEVDLIWNSRVCGVLLILLGISEISAFARWKPWCTTFLGAWLFISPQVLGYPQANPLAISCIIFGLVTLVLAGWSIGDTHKPLPPI